MNLGQNFRSSSMANRGYPNDLHQTAKEINSSSSSIFSEWAIRRESLTVFNFGILKFLYMNSFRIRAKAS